MYYEKSLLAAIVIGLSALAFTVSEPVASSVEREFWRSDQQVVAARRSRVKQRRQQLGTLRSFARYSHRAKRVVRVKPVVSASLSISRAPASLRAQIAHIERTWGPVKIVSVCRPGATFNQGGKRHPSWHGSCRAIDFEPPAKHRAAVLAYLRKTTPGYVLTYSGKMTHIHIDNAREGNRYAAQPKTWPVTVQKPAVKATAKPAPKVAATVPLPRPRPAVAINVPNLDSEAMPVALYVLEKPKQIKPLEPIRPQDQDAIFALDAARRYLIQTATLGGTMTRQTPQVAIGNLHPKFTVRLAAAVKQARLSGLPKAGVFSAYRAPFLGVGGFSDKFNSLHAYGLAVDMTGIGRSGSKESKLWQRIALAHKIYSPYGPNHRAEWNHYSPSWTRMIGKYEPLRKTISARGPIDLPAMWKVADRLIDNTAQKVVNVSKKKLKWAKRYVGKKWASWKKKIKKRRSVA